MAVQANDKLSRFNVNLEELFKLDFMKILINECYELSTV